MVKVKGWKVKRRMTAEKGRDIEGKTEEKAIRN